MYLATLIIHYVYYYTGMVLSTILVQLKKKKHEFVNFIISVGVLELTDP